MTFEWIYMLLNYTHTSPPVTATVSHVTMRSGAVVNRSLRQTIVSQRYLAHRPLRGGKPHVGFVVIVLNLVNTLFSLCAYTWVCARGRVGVWHLPFPCYCLSQVIEKTNVSWRALSVWCLHSQLVFPPATWSKSNLIMSTSEERHWGRVYCITWGQGWQ